VLNQTLSKMHVGMAAFQPIPAFTYYPGENIVKLFEYASLGIPYIISDFPGIRKFVEKNGGGILVDPTNVNEIAKTIEKLFNEKELYKKLSVEGKNMVINEYNWDLQEKILISAYNKLLKK
jgi:glycosyltransferase involved in cell wall biosynthesis